MACCHQYPPAQHHPGHPCGVHGPGFHARFSATGKTYRYCISSEPILNPFDAGLAWHRPLAWSLDALTEAAGLFLGEHDFTAFAALRGNEPRPIPEDYFRRTITRADVRREGNHTFITFTGTGFLYKMVPPHGGRGP